MSTTENKVIYEVGMKDKLSAGVEGMSAHVNKLEGALKSVNGIIGALGIAAAGFKIVGFIEESNHEWEKMEFSISQVEAALKSTDEAAGLSFNQLKDSAERMSHNIKFSQSEILGMQSVLLTFPKVTRESFDQASEIITDMSTRLGTDLKSTTIQVGKALQDPVRGINALRRAGVNFTESQQDMIKNLVRTNQAAKAQALIMAELRTEFGGSALAAAEADKEFRFDKTMEENKIALGELLDEMKEKAQPVLIKMAQLFRDGIEWVSKNKHEIKQWGIAIAAAVVAAKAMAIIPPLLLAIENGLVAASIGAGGFATAMAAAFGPITLIAAGVGALVLAFEKFQTYAEAEKKGLAKEQAEYTQELQNRLEIHKNDKEITKKILEEEEQRLNQSTAMTQKALNEEMATRDKLFKKAKGYVQDLSYDEKMALSLASENVGTLEKDLKLLKADQAGLSTVKTNLIKVQEQKKFEESIRVKAPKTQGVGSKNVTITVHIKELIHQQTISTTYLKESAAKIKELVTAALTGAINDFQVTAAGL